MIKTYVHKEGGYKGSYKGYNFRITYKGPRNWKGFIYKDDPEQPLAKTEGETKNENVESIEWEINLMK